MEIMAVGVRARMTTGPDYTRDRWHLWGEGGPETTDSSILYGSYPRRFHFWRPLLTEGLTVALLQPNSLPQESPPPKQIKKTTQLQTQS